MVLWVCESKEKGEERVSSNGTSADCYQGNVGTKTKKKKSGLTEVIRKREKEGRRGEEHR
jgi:hypothetical protein